MSESVTKFITPRVCAQISQIVFLVDLTVLRLITTVWVKMSQNSYLHEFCAQVSQNVFLADLTILRFITTVWAKMSENSYLRGFCATNITNRVHSWFDRFTAYYYCMSKNVTKLISPRVLCTSITKRVLSWFDRFTVYNNCMSKNVRKLISPRVLCNKYHKSCS